MNALELPQGLAPQACMPLLDYVTGPRAQFLTGQVLRLAVTLDDTENDSAME
ncbi:hypothetical protein [Variovorax paradoxus]|uniref:hypothetical protein n=1 Tax=Variovorax paradoxus TaxID=34073 RepID=UPI0027D7EDD6|nr:hypothetical protein [Variovorax paradoxus]